MFGIGQGEQPKPTSAIQTELLGELQLSVTWKHLDDVVGYNVLWGHAPDKLYHSHMVFGVNLLTIKALVKGQPVYVRVDTFNEVGITEGEVSKAGG